MQKLGPPDSFYLDAAIGWLGLGCPDDARQELKHISPQYLQHPDVLEACWLLCAHVQNWQEALNVASMEMDFMPESASGWLHQAYALRRVAHGGLAQAWEALLPAAQKFPEEPIIPYNLSCYACQLLQYDKARRWLQQAIKVGNKKSIIQMALADDDLQPLWPEIAEL